MNTYRVTAGPVAYTMRAPSIQAASQFVKHWPGVTVRRLEGTFYQVRGSLKGHNEYSTGPTEWLGHTTYQHGIPYIPKRPFLP